MRKHTPIIHAKLGRLGDRLSLSSLERLASWYRDYCEANNITNP